MTKEMKKVKLRPDSRLALLLREAVGSGRLVVVDTGDALYSLSIGMLDTRPGDPGPDEVVHSKEGILRAAGAWRGVVDAEVFKGYIRKRRRTSSRAPVCL